MVYISIYISYIHSKKKRIEASNHFTRSKLYTAHPLHQSALEHTDPKCLEWRDVHMIWALRKTKFATIATIFSYSGMQPWQRVIIKNHGLLTDPECLTPCIAMAL